MSTFELGFMVVLLGLGIVFIVLAALIYLINLLEFLSKSKASKVINLIEEPNEIIVEENNDLVALITSAVYAVLSNEQVRKSNLGFVVRSIKRI